MSELLYMEPNIPMNVARDAQISLLTFFFFFLISYLIGSFHLSYFIGKNKGINLKEVGSKNFGASNAFALIGKKAGLLVFLSDFFKGFLAIYLYQFLSPLFVFLNDLFTQLGLFPIVLSIHSSGPYTLDFCSVLCYSFIVLGVVLGHIYPFYLKFNGGKGFATYLGALVAFSISFDINFIPLILFAIILALLTDYIVAATFSIIILFPILVIYSEGLLGVDFAMASLVILYKHKENIINIITNNGKEMKIRSALKNKYKVENKESDKDSENNK